MQKIISLFKRDYEGNRQVYDEIVEGAEWVQEGEGVATVKWDGTACMFRGGKLFKRYDRKMKHGKYRDAPDGWEAAQEPDAVTGHWPGWVPLVNDNPADRWHLEAWGHISSSGIHDGTYELIGPKVQGNPHFWRGHELLPHGLPILADFPRTFDDIKSEFEKSNSTVIEGVVWHHPDRRMVKIKRKDFGLLWPVK